MFRACDARIFLVGIFLMLIALQWKGCLHISSPHTWVPSWKEEERKRQGPSHLNPSASPQEQSCPEAPPSTLGLAPQGLDLDHMAALVISMDGKSEALVFQLS